MHGLWLFFLKKRQFTWLLMAAMAVEARIREAVPVARVIYLEPDIYVDPAHRGLTTDAIVIKGSE